MAEKADVSSSTDNIDIQELCSDLSYTICLVEAKTDLISDQLKTICRHLKEIKTFVLDTHANIDHNAREDILGDTVFVEELRPLIDQLSEISDEAVRRMAQR